MPLDGTLPVFWTGTPQYPEAGEDGLIPAHEGVDALLACVGLPAGNPLGEWIQPGMNVLIKPNWVRHAAEGWADLSCLITHTSIIRPVVERCADALRLPDGSYSGKIILADAPLQSADFDLLLEQAGIQPLLAHWRSLGIPIELRDLRRIAADVDESTGIVHASRALMGDPAGDTVVDLAGASRLESIALGADGFGVSNYDASTTTRHHQPGIHRYRIANSLLQADVVINLPKWKTHVKTGVTGALKNFIGINCDKAYLPHFRPGPPKQGGDEYPDSRAGVWIARLRPWLERVVPGGLIRTARRSLLHNRRHQREPLVFGGAWPGNDTLWRTIHDMVHIVRWVTIGGTRRSTPRPILTILDAIIAGEADGPLRPEPAPMGALGFCLDPGQMDVWATALSGFSHKGIPMLAHLEDPEARAITSFDAKTPLPAPLLALEPPVAWAATLRPTEAADVAA